MIVEEFTFKVKNKKENEQDIDVLIETLNPKVISKNLYDYLRLFHELKKENNYDVIEKILNKLNTKNGRYVNILRYIFDKNFDKKIPISDYLYIISWENISTDTLNEIISILRIYLSEEEINGIKMRYSSFFTDKIYDEKDIDFEDLFRNFKIENINEDDYRDYVSLYANFKNSTLKNIVDKIFIKKPDIVFDFPYSDNFYEKFKDLSTHVKCKNLNYIEMDLLNNICLKISNNSKKFDFSDDAYILVSKSLEFKSLNVELQNKILKNVVEIEKTNIKYAKSGSEIFLSGNISKQVSQLINEDISNIKIIIDGYAANEYYNELLKITNKDNVKIGFGTDTSYMTLDEYIKAHKFYDSLAELINRFNLSPIEKYLYAYDLTRKFKKYRLYGDSREIDKTDPSQSRNPYLIINNEYIVCAGFANFLDELLSRCNIPSKYLTLTANRDDSEWVTHARVVSHIKDEKYSIDGIYIGDPTFDSKTKGFSHAFMTKTKQEYEEEDYYSRNEYINAFKSLVDHKGYEYSDLMDKKIPENVIISVINNLYNTIYAHLEENEIEEIINNALNDSYLFDINEDTLKQPLYEINRDIVWSILESSSKKYKAKIIASQSDPSGFSYEIGIKVEDGILSNITNILFYHKNSFENEYVSFSYSQYKNLPGFKIKLARNATLGELKNVFDNTIKIIKKIMEENLLLSEENIEQDVGQTFK